MSLSRSPSPSPGGGWASPGLNSSYGGTSGRSSPQKSYRGNGNSVTWESAKAKSAGVNGGYPSFSTQNNGFFNRHYRSISNSLPRFNMGSDKSYAEKEKLGRGRWMPRDGKLGRLRAALGRTSRRARISFVLFVGLIIMYFLFYSTRMSRYFSLWTILTEYSFTLLVAQGKASRRRQEIRCHTRSKPGRWSNGVERTPRVGDRARQCPK
jgi:mannan polymerase II complex MNN10 subunit